MLRIALIGTGGIANGHAQGAEALSDLVQVTALCDTDPARLARFSKRFPDAVAVSDWRELLARDDIDAFDVCLPHHLHAPCITDAANAGKHVLCEKPLCMNEREADAITEAIERNRVTLMCAHNQVFDPAVRRAKQLLDEGAIGHMWQVRTMDCFTARNYAPGAWGWRGDKATMGGGVLIDTGYHPSYLLLHLAGQRPKSVCAMVSKHSANSLEGEDTAEVLVSFENGVRGAIHTSWAYDAPSGNWQFHMIGDKGQLYGRGNKIYVQPTGFHQGAMIELGAVNVFAEEMRHFAESLQNGTRPVQDHQDGIDVLKLILGAYRSVEEGRIVTF